MSDNEFTDWFDAHDNELLVMECEDIARTAFFAGMKAAQQSVHSDVCSRAARSILHLVRSSRGNFALSAAHAGNAKPLVAYLQRSVMELKVIYEHEEMRDMVVHVNSDGMQKIMAILADENNIITTQLTQRAPDEAIGCAHRFVRLTNNYSLICDGCGKTLRR